jgi:hypothetical protein
MERRVLAETVGEYAEEIRLDDWQDASKKVQSSSEILFEIRLKT